jgi:glycosyltransferase involved in cell wall biosynthesis
MIIHPPVDVDRIQPNGRDPEDFYLLVGGFVQYKREGVAIEAFRKRSERLVVVGDGPTRQSLESTAPPNVEFTGRLSDEEISTCFQTCRALIHPQEEDFGIAAVEAQAAGRPVIAYGSGGARDTVRPLLTAHASGELQWADDSDATGLYFSEQTPEALGAALDAFSKHSALLDARRIRVNAERFSSQRFLAEIAAEIADASGQRSSDPRPGA